MTRTVQIQGTDLTGADQRQNATVPIPGTIRVDSQGQIVGLPLVGITTTFELLPATAVAAGTDSFFLLTGTSAVAAAQAATGGVQLVSNTTNATCLAGVLTSGMSATIRAASEIEFYTRLNLAAVTAVVASAGLQETTTANSTDPTATAGEGALFLFDPTVTVSTGLTTAQHLNWILAHKVNGADTFTATTIPVAAGVDYELRVKIQPNLTAFYYINGVYVGVGPTLTSGDIVRGFAGAKGTAAAQTLTIRYASLHRNIG